MKHIKLFENFENEFIDLFTQIKNSEFSPISKKDFNDLEEEGWIEEIEDKYNVLLDKSMIIKLELIIPENDKFGLINFDEETIEKYNRFDIALKSKGKISINDFIDYDKGIVYIFKIK